MGKTVSVWLSAEDPDWNNLPQDIRDTCARCRENKYMIAAFRSGSEDIFDNTCSLLQYNRRLSAENEVRDEKAAAEK